MPCHSAWLLPNGESLMFVQLQRRWRAGFAAGIPMVACPLSVGVS